MIDFHNHILPNIDDGSKSLDISLKMLESASQQGIREVVNTVHFQHPKVEMEDISYSRIKNKLQNLQNELNKNNIDIKLHSGAEVFFLPNLLKLKDNPLATFDNGKYMLIEFPSLQIPQIQRQQLFDLKLSGVTPIIAHPERYKNVQDDVSMVSDWLEAGCIIQVDAGSILGGLGSKSKKVAEEIVKNGWCQIIGSDSHNSTNRNFCLKEALHLSKKWIGDIAGNMVNENPKAVLEGLSINTDIEYDYEKQRTLLSRLKKVIGIT